MNEKPILFSGEMVRAILDGRKTMTRRVVKPQPEYGVMPCHWSRTGWSHMAKANEHGAQGCTCNPIAFPYVHPDGLLWVRESFSYITKAENEHFDKRRPDGCPVEMLYRADAVTEGWEKEVTWSPSIHMPRWASRLTLRVTAVRVERLQDITEEDARAEGVEPKEPNHVVSARYRFAQLWNSINAKRGHSWESNCLVWVVGFEPLANGVIPEKIGE